MKIILEGQFEISDETGQKVTASPGDVFYFPKGVTITFTTPDYGLAFFVSRSSSGEQKTMIEGPTNRYRRRVSVLRGKFRLA